MDDETAGKKLRIRYGFRRDYNIGKRDWYYLLGTGSLQVMKWSREKCEDCKISSALSFVFSNERFKLLSWGSIRIGRDGEWALVLGLLSKMSTENL